MSETFSEDDACQTCNAYELDSDGSCEGCGYLEIECMCAPHVPGPWSRGYNTDYGGAFPSE